MIISITGGIRSGKTSFALHYAATFGWEGIYITTHGASLPDGLPTLPHFTWQTITAQYTLPEVLHRINKQSNLYRADQRVLVVDSVTSYLFATHEQIVEGNKNKCELKLAEYTKWLTEVRMSLQEALFTFQDKLFVITNELSGFTPFTDPFEIEYVVQHSALNRELVKQSAKSFYMISGRPKEMSVELYT